MSLSVEALTEIIKVKDAEIIRLTDLIEKLFSQLSEKRNKPAGEIRRPLVLDEKTKQLRPKTDSEISAEMNALKEMGIF